MSDSGSLVLVEVWGRFVVSFLVSVGPVVWMWIVKKTKYGTKREGRSKPIKWIPQQATSGGMRERRKRQSSVATVTEPEIYAPLPAAAPCSRLGASGENAGDASSQSETYGAPVVSDDGRSQEWSRQEDAALQVHI